MGKKKLPTESELRKKLQGVCDVINGLNPKEDLSVYECENSNHMRIFGDIGNFFLIEYLPDIDEGRRCYRFKPKDEN